MTDVRRGIEVSGVVQGVGFRPFAYRLATERRLSGTIANTPAGVAIEVQGPPGDVEDFIGRLSLEAPPLAHVTGVAVRDLAWGPDGGFRILASRAGEPARTLVSPDVAVCDACLGELFEPGDRRYRYPFINCTDCGPRFTIVRDIPYDRARTSMAAFTMCPACRAEYDDPASRRFHAQPNACWDCGPQAALWDAAGRRLEEGDPIAAAAGHLAAGRVVAVKGLGGFHLAADAARADAVDRLRERKARVAKPFAVMAASLEAAARLARLDDAAAAALRRPERPIVLVPKGGDGVVADAVAPGVGEVGLFLPYTPLHHLLFAAGPFDALVMTSGNRAEEPIAIDNREAVERLAGLADLFLVHDRDVVRRCDDSVVRPVGGRVRPLRRARGYVPLPVALAEEVPPVLAVGGELNNTVCLTRGRQAFLSQHVGDLENLEAHGFFEEAIDHLGRILEVEPRAIAHDLHPDYHSTRWALAREGLPRVAVQHHHAHVASCMAENGLSGRVIGFALDGTGYGTDGHVWGGEVLVAGYDGFTRAAHLDEVPLPGGAAAIREPWRMAVAWLWRHYGRRFLDWRLPGLEKVGRRALETALALTERGLLSPRTSSCGRLFDAVSALLGVCSRATYEGQAAVELEAIAADGDTPRDAYRFELEREQDAWVIGTRGLFDGLVEDVHAGVAPGLASRRFHDGLADVLADVAASIRDATGLDRVCLSGGTFQNVRLTGRLRARLERRDFRVFTHGVVPPGDGGLSLGQALVAAHSLGGGSRGGASL
ncbi:MAG: carbamoyltransferase HypF [Acidobacteria bacterium]|nr:carbamoyltransferase HypF [Acidobacteriota bacterium]